MVHPDDELALDAEQGLLYQSPPPDIRKQLLHRLRQQQEQQAQATAQPRVPLTFQGHHIALLANVANELEAETARQQGAEGIGLLRTELLFAAEKTWPNEQ